MNLSRSIIKIKKTSKHFYIFILNKDKIVKTISSLNMTFDKNEKSITLSNKVADYLIEHKIKNIHFERSGYRFHGNVKKFVDNLFQRLS